MLKKEPICPVSTGSEIWRKNARVFDCRGGFGEEGRWKMAGENVMG
jgi:hypothetical protein